MTKFKNKINIWKITLEVVDELFHLKALSKSPIKVKYAGLKLAIWMLLSFGILWLINSDWLQLRLLAGPFFAYAFEGRKAHIFGFSFELFVASIDLLFICAGMMLFRLTFKDINFNLRPKLKEAGFIILLIFLVITVKGFVFFRTNFNFNIGDWTDVIVVAGPALLISVITEEIVSRGIILTVLGKLFKNIWLAVLIQGEIFGLFHVFLRDRDIISRILMGIIYGFLAVRTRSLLPAIGLHYINNLIIYMTR